MSSIKHRHLSRSSSHRQALLRNLVTSLIDLESIATTWPKAKEAQRMAEKLITLGKRNTPAARSKAQAMLYNPDRYLDKVFGTLRERYALRPGGYTRVLRTEPKKDDQAPSAILELVDGPKDMRFAMTARTLLKLREEEKSMNEITSLNVHKVTRFRKDGEADLEREVSRLERLKLREAKEDESQGSEDEWVDDELVERIEVPKSLLKRRKNESAKSMPTTALRQKKRSLPEPSNLHRRQKMTTEEVAA